MQRARPCSADGSVSEWVCSDFSLGEADRLHSTSKGTFRRPRIYDFIDEWERLRFKRFDSD